MREPFPGLQPNKEQWGDGVWTVPSVSMGHQLQVTTVRLAYAHAALVNGGYLFKPRLFMNQVNEPPRKVLSEKVSAFLREAMTDVVEMKHRVWLPRDPGFRWGGKSGTTQKTNSGHVGEYTSLFAAFGPTADPEIVVVIVADNPKGEEHYGSKVSGVAAGQVLRRAVELMSSPPRSFGVSGDFDSGSVQGLAPTSSGVMFSTRKP